MLKKGDKTTRKRRYLTLSNDDIETELRKEG